MAEADCVEEMYGEVEGDKEVLIDPGRGSISKERAVVERETETVAAVSTMNVLPAELKHLHPI